MAICFPFLNLHGLSYLPVSPPAVLAILTYLSMLRLLRAGGVDTDCADDAQLSGNFQHLSTWGQDTAWPAHKP
ncbi:hypothetical protein BG55_13095 [Erwinia mallotivora]|uniref:Uncharacterized protein n=1 Tax=Erwinia mallotivora TaxID=69222 RepID=A0A014MAJ2_9GAMM|nr:hypothetical protein BG55_13095 [Erwinia mallotivora]